MRLIEKRKRIPPNARNLIIYYGISSVPIAADILFPIYLFILNWKIIEIGILYSVGYLFSIVGGIIIGYLFDKGLQPKYAMMIVDFFAFLTMMLYFVSTKPEHIFFCDYIILLGGSPHGGISDYRKGAISRRNS